MRHYFDTVEDRVTGRPVAGAQIYVRTAPLTEGGVNAAIYSDDETPPTAITQPIVTGQDGFFSFYADDGRYCLQIYYNGALIRTLENVEVSNSLADAQAAATSATAAALSAAAAEQAFETGLPQLEAYANAAAASADDAEAYAQALFVDTFSIWYSSLAAGAAAVAEGESFIVVDGGTVVLGKKVGGIGVEQAEFATMAAFLSELSGVITVNEVQTLTNKTIALGSNSVSGTLAQFNDALTDANFATLAGAETLTNKTIALGNNTLSGTLAQFNAAVSDADLTSTAALAATTGAALIGKTGGGTVQDAITAFADVVRGDPTSPSWSLFVGTDAANGTTTSLRTTALGVGALQAITSGNLNTAAGSLALNSNTSGAVNTAVGADALGDNTTGEYNNAFGCKALVGNTTGSRNNAFGQSAMMYADTGNDNCAFGQDTMIQLASGSRNCGFGNSVLSSLVSGVDNCAFGVNALYYVTGSNNGGFGKDALFSTTSGTANNGVGYQVLYSNSTGSNNNALGQVALAGNTTGTGNTGLGHRAGYGAAGDEATTVDTNCTFIGINASRSSAVPTATVLTNSTAIGNDSKFTKSNQVSLGDNAVTEIRAPGPGFLASTTDFNLSKTSTAGGTTGAQTINKPAGSVNFAAAATSLVVTNSLVTASSVIIATVATNDSTMKSVAAVAGSGSFTLHANAAATAETRVSFLVIN